MILLGPREGEPSQCSAIQVSDASVLSRRIKRKRDMAFKWQPCLAGYRRVIVQGTLQADCSTSDAHLRFRANACRQNTLYTLELETNQECFTGELSDLFIFSH